MTSGLVFWLVFTPTAIGVWQGFKRLSSGWTQVQTNRSLNRHREQWSRVVKEGSR